MPDSLAEQGRIRKLADEILAHPDYELSPRPVDEPQAESPAFSWLDENVFDPLSSFLNRLFGGAIWLQWLVLGALAGVVIWAVIRWWVKRQPNIRNLKTATTTTENVPPDRLVQAAQEAAAIGNFPEAARLLMRACVLRLEAAEQRVNRPGTTNREVLRRYRAASIHDDIRRLVDTVDQSWFGERECGPIEYAEVVAAFDRVEEFVRSRIPRRLFSGGQHFPQPGRLPTQVVPRDDVVAGR